MSCAGNDGEWLALSDAILATGIGVTILYVGPLVGSRFTVSFEPVPFGGAEINMLHPFGNTLEPAEKYLVGRQLKKNVLLSERT